MKDQSPADTGYKSHQLSRQIKCTCDLLQNNSALLDCLMQKTEWGVQRKAKCSKMKVSKHVKKALIMCACPDKAFTKTAKKSYKNTKLTGTAQHRQSNIVIWTI